MIDYVPVVELHAVAEAQHTACTAENMRLYRFSGNSPGRDTALSAQVAALVLCAAVALAEGAGAPDGVPLATFEHMAMGTRFECTLAPPQPGMQVEELSHLADEAFSVIDTIERRISNWRADSETALVNRRAAEEAVAVSSPLIDLLLEAKRIHGDTGAAFDVTVGPLLDLWGFYTREGHLPTDDEIKAALAKVGLEKVAVDEHAQTVRFAVPGMRLDFGGIGKGLALERAANVLRSLGVTSALLNSGTSTVEAIGAPPGMAGWTIRIRNAYNNEGEHIAEVRISNESLSTSSSTENFLELDGKRYGHILDPKTGWPVSGLLSATVIGPGGMETDALSTAFFVMGEEKVRAYCAAHPEYRAILVLSENGTPRVVQINFPSQEEQES